MRNLIPNRSTLSVRIAMGGLPTCLVLAVLLGVRSTSPASATTVRPGHPTLPELLRELRNAKPAPQPTLADSLAAEAGLPDSMLHRPLEKYFSRFTSDQSMARRVTKAVVHYARVHDVAPSLVAAVLVTENRTLKPHAASSVGAQGLMQVMPMHAGSYGCASADLRTVDANICHGARILHLYMVRSRSVTIALRRYNGCVRGANTPRCSRYPGRVLQTAARLRRDILVGGGPADQRVRT